MAIATKAQASFDEEMIENADLEALLEQREKLKDEAGQTRKDYIKKDEEAKGIVHGLDITDGDVKRCGRFLLSVEEVKAGHRSFATKAKTKVSIRLAKE